MIMCPEGYEAFTLQGADVWVAQQEAIRRDQEAAGTRGTTWTTAYVSSASPCREANPLRLYPASRRPRTRSRTSDHPDPHPPKNPGPYTKTA